MTQNLDCLIIQTNHQAEFFQNMMITISKYKKVLQFLEQNSLDVNFDGLFGLRVSQGFLILFKYIYNKKYKIFKKIYLL